MSVFSAHPSVLSRRPLQLLAAAAAASLMVVAAPAVAPAQAAVVIEVIDGISYAYDNSAGPSGRFATITDYDPTEGPDVVIPGSVELARNGGGTASYTVATIGLSAFANNGLTSVTVPASVAFIVDYAFGGNPALSEVFLLGAAPTITAAGATGSFGVSGVTTLYVPWSELAAQGGSYTTPVWEGYASAAVATVSFDANGHGTAPASVSVVVGDTTTAPTPSPSAPGYTFRRWFTDSAAGTRWEFTTDTVTGDMTLYAGWQRNMTGPVFTGATTSTATVGRSFTWTPDVLTGYPDPTVVLMNNTLPVGLTLNTVTGEISGIPVDTAGDYTMAMFADNGVGLGPSLTLTITLLPGDAQTMQLQPDITTVDQGGTVTITATGVDQGGNSMDPTADIAFTSDVPTDVIHGNTITFPHASPHTITATYLPTGMRISILITVNPAAGGLIAVTGTDTAQPTLWTGIVILLTGALVLILARRRRTGNT